MHLPNLHMTGIRVLLVAIAAVAFGAVLAPLSSLNAYVGQNPYSVNMAGPSGPVSCTSSPNVTATVREAETGRLVTGQSIRWDIKKGQSSADSVTPRNTVTDSNGQSTVTVHFGPVSGERTVRATIASWPATIRITCTGGAGTPTPTNSPGPTPTDGPTGTPTATPTRTPTPVGQTPTPTPTATPVGQTPTPTPVGETPTPTPVDQTPTPTPVGETPTPTPVGQTPTPTPVGQTPTPEGQTPGVEPTLTPEVPVSPSPDPGLPTDTPSLDPGATGTPLPTGVTPSDGATALPTEVTPGSTDGPQATEAPQPVPGEGAATSDVIPILLLVLVVGGLGALGLVAVTRR